MDASGLTLDPRVFGVSEAAAATGNVAASWVDIALQDFTVEDLRNGDKVVVMGTAELENATGRSQLAFTVTLPDLSVLDAIAFAVFDQHGSPNEGITIPVQTAFQIGQPHTSGLNTVQTGTYRFRLRFRALTAGTTTKRSSTFTVMVYRGVAALSAKTTLSTGTDRPLGRGQNVLGERGPFAPSP